MSKKGAIPDAWDDDWENLADKPQTQAAPEPVKLSKAERKAQHQELQKQLWDTAEHPNRMHWLETQGIVPLRQEIKPQVTLLSRKPTPTIAKRNVGDGIAGLALDDDDDSEEEARKKREVDFEERQRRAMLEREEKQRKYAEARERIMGSSNKPASTPASRESSQGRDSRRPRGRGGLGRAPARDSSGEQSPVGAVADEKPLFDPNDMGRRLQRREASKTPDQEGPLRQPRGPDRSGRGGFGFGGRGAASSG